MHEQLEIRLFGGLSVHRDGTQVNQFASRKAEALLAFLVCNPNAHQRATLAELLWADRTPQQAGGNLRVLITSLRQTVGEYLNLDSGHPLSVRPNEHLWVDVYEFSECLANIDLNINLVRNYLHGLSTTPMLSAAESNNIQKALGLYQGEFLYGLKLKNASGFDDWVTAERAKYAHLAYYAADRLASHALVRADFQDGITWAQLMLRLDILNEEGHRKMMVLRYLNGQRNAAIDQYDIIQELLEDELGVPPSPETVSLFQQIRVGGVAAPAPRAKRGPKSLANEVDLSKRQTTEQSSHRSEGVRNAIPHNLTKSLTTLIGREKEAEQLADRLTNPERRLITISGPGGIGKTLLAEEAAWRTYAEAVKGSIFPDGIFFVSLSSVPVPELIVFAIAAALDIDLSKEALDDDIDGRHALIQRLAEKEFLLVLDNVEHLITARNLIQDLLLNIPSLTILVTSREYLGMRGEWRLDLNGLACINDLHLEDEDFENDPSFHLILGGASGNTPWVAPGKAPVSLDELPPALRLFETVATQVDANFTISEGNLLAIWQICSLLDGMPLGIELAASLVNDTSCNDIARGVATNKDMLKATTWDTPDRQRNLRAVFNHSWSLLEQKNRDLFTRLGVFTGGFTAKAAEAVADANAKSLGRLVAKSLIKKTRFRTRQFSTDSHDADSPNTDSSNTDTPNTIRYESHAALHQYISEILTEDTALRQEMQAHHANYFCQSLIHHPQLLASERSADAAAEIATEIQNIRAAWQWSIQNSQIIILEKLLSVLALYYQLRGLNREGESLFQGAIALLEPSNTLGPSALPSAVAHSDEFVRSMCLILIELAHCQQNQSKHIACIENAQRVIESASVIDAQDLMAQGHYRWGVALTRTGAGEEALTQIQRAATLAQSAGNIMLQGHSLYQMAVIEWQRGNYALAYSNSDQAVEIYSELHYPRGMGNALTLHGIVSSLQGNFEASCASYDQALKIYREIGDLYGEGFVTINLGRVWAERGNYAKADNYYGLSLSLNEEISNHYGVSSIILSQGRDAAWRGDFDAASPYLEDALTSKANIQDHFGKADVLVSKSFLTLLMGQKSEALHYADEALTLATELKDISLQAYAHMNRGRALESLGKLEEARSSYQNAYDIRTKLGQRNLLLEPLAGLAHIAYLEGRTKEAVGWVTPILERIGSGVNRALDGTDDPIFLMLVCYLILAETNGPDADSVLQKAHQLLIERADTIVDAAKRQLYFEMRPSHAAILDLYQKR